MSNEPHIGTLPSGVQVSDGDENANHQTERLPGHQYCVFRTGRELYCLSVSEVEEVVEWSSLTRVPLAPSFLMGIFNLRGVIIPILDISFLEDRRPDALPTHLVVAVWGGETDRGVLRIGLAADEMFGAYFTSEPLLVEEAPSDVPHCRGMLRYGKRLALALNLRRLGEAFPIPTI
jgi:chemotaxis signal transduction protein